MLEETGFDPWASGDDALVMLSLVNKFLGARQKLHLLSRAARFPFRFVLSGDRGGAEFHERAEVTGPVSSRHLASIYASGKAAISGNPSNMSGAISDPT